MDMSTRCRLCLAESEEIKSMLSAGNNFISLWDMYGYIMNAGELIDSAFVPHVCVNCEADLKSAYTFQVMCSESEQTLSELVHSDRLSLVKSDCESETEFVPSEVIDEEAEDICTTDALQIDTTDVYDRNDEEPETEVLQYKDNSTADVAEVYDKNVCSESVSIDANIDEIATVAENVTERVESKVTKGRKCKICNVHYATIKSYGLHYRQLHYRPNPNYVRPKPKLSGRTCRICNIHYETMKSYMVHYRQLHYRPAKRTSVTTVLCSHCGKLVPQHSIGRHLQYSHSINRETDHTCTQCGKTFTRLSNLIQHQRIHANDKR